MHIFHQTYSCTAHAKHPAHRHRYTHKHTHTHTCRVTCAHIHTHTHTYIHIHTHTFSLTISALQLTAPTAVPKSVPKLVTSHSDRGYYIGMLDSVERERCELKKKCFMLMQKRIEHQLETLRETSRRFEQKLHVRQEKAKVYAHRSFYMYTVTELLITIDYRDVKRHI